MKRATLGRSLMVILGPRFLPLLARLAAPVIAWIGGGEAAPEPAAAGLRGKTDWSGVIGRLATFGWFARVSLPVAGGQTLPAPLQARGRGRC